MVFDCRVMIVALDLPGAIDPEPRCLKRIGSGRGTQMHSRVRGEPVHQRIEPGRAALVIRIVLRAAPFHAVCAISDPDVDPVGGPKVTRPASS